jgi:site-specific DNA recombinase
MKIALYCRVSSAAQERQGTIQTQVAVAERYCAGQGVKIISRYLDDGISGSVPIRERLNGSKLWADAEAGKFDLLLVHSLSRLARSTIEILNVLEFFERRGIAIKSLTQDIDTGTATGKFFITALASMDQLTRDNIRESSRHGLERIVREGKWSGGKPPFGYCVENKRLAIDPVQSDIVRRIFGWYLSGLRLRAIAARLNAADVKHPLDWNKPLSRIWWESTVNKILRNPSYIGQWFWRKRTDRRKVAGLSTCTKTSKEQQIAVTIPRIISEEDFEEVQRTLTANQSASFRNVKNFYLLRGLIYCRKCGLKYIGMTSGKKPWVKQFYRCRSRISTPQLQACGAKHVRADLLDQAVWQFCVDFAEDPSPVIDEMRKTMETGQSRQWEYRMDDRRLDNEIVQRSEQRAQTINLHRRGLIDDSEAERELNRLRTELEAMRAERRELSEALSTAEQAEYRVLTAESMLNLMAETVLNADDRIKREVVLSWIDRIEIETLGEGRYAHAVAHVRFVFQPSQTVTSVEPAVATSRARFAACCPRTSRKSTL